LVTALLYLDILWVFDLEEGGLETAERKFFASAKAEVPIDKLQFLLA
jgi:hypothetical protein